MEITFTWSNRTYKGKLSEPKKVLGGYYLFNLGDCGIAEFSVLTDSKQLEAGKSYGPFHVISISSLN